MDLVTLPRAVKIASFYGMALAAGSTGPGDHMWKVNAREEDPWRQFKCAFSFLDRHWFGEFNQSLRNRFHR